MYIYELGSLHSLKKTVFLLVPEFHNVEDWHVGWKTV